MSFFEDQDRDRMRGDGEFTVQQEHLEVVDLGPSPVSSVSTPGIRFANPDLNSDDLVGKITTCNEVLQHVRQGLTARGFSAVSLLQGLIQESDTDQANVFQDLVWMLWANWRNQCGSNPGQIPWFRTP